MKAIAYSFVAFVAATVAFPNASSATVTAQGASVAAEVYLSSLGSFTDADSDSWGTTLEPLSARALVIEAGRGAGLTDVDATWSSAAAGDIAITLVGELTGDRISTVYNSFIDRPSSPNWVYSFTTDTDSYFTLNYDLLSTGSFGAGGFRLFSNGTSVGYVSDPGGGSVGSLSLLLTGGQNYEISLDNSAGFSRSGGLPSGYTSTGKFNFAITAANGVAAGVPEPATWLMMLVGFGTIAFAMRRQQRQTMRYNFA